MVKPSDENSENLQEILQELKKISSAKVMNGGFDRLVGEVAQVKEMQAKLNIDFEAHKINDDRIETKLDRLYDPETGIYTQLRKTEAVVSNLNEKVSSLKMVDDKIFNKLDAVTEQSAQTAKELGDIKKITGEEHKELQKAVKLTRGAWWLGGLAITGLLSALGKLLWDLFVG